MYKLIDVFYYKSVKLQSLSEENLERLFLEYALLLAQIAEKSVEVEALKAKLNAELTDA